ncbi:hypothetical protein J6W78_01750 [bacterium]|nr:hypothetical protein [bacterium]
MKKNSLFILFVFLFFFAGCGDGGTDYDQYGDTGDSGKDDDTADTVSDKDSADTSDADPVVQPDEDGETVNDEDNDGSNVDDDSSSTQDFWSTCEGIIACAKGCSDDDSDCVNSCYVKGSDDGQLYYRRWRECFDNACAEDKTAECSAENCADWDEWCNVAAAFEYELTIPAPYGNVEFAGDFSFILNNSYPTSDTQLVYESFASGQISSTPVTPGGTMISFVRTAADQRDGKVVEVYQIPYNANATTQTIGNPVVLLRIKTDAATEGDHIVGVGDESEARLIVGEIDSKYNFSCYHAFGIGSFKIDKAVIETGSAGSLSFSKGSAELFNPQNIPELGGDATEILGVESCSLIW